MPTQLSLFEVEPLPASREAEIAKQEFELSFMLLLDEMQERIKFRILVWGPSIHSESEVAKKRRTIHRVLRDEDKHHCWMSEEFQQRPPGVSLKAFELAQARKADMIVMLVEAHADGVLGEMHDFCSHKELLSKILLFFPKNMQEGYNGKGLVDELERGYRIVERYTDADISRCNVLTMTRDWVKARRSYAFSTSGG